MDMLDPDNVKGEFLKPQKIGDSPIIFTVPKNTGTKARQRNFRLVASMALILHPSSIWAPVSSLLWGSDLALEHLLSRGSADFPSPRFWVGLPDQAMKC